MKKKQVAYVGSEIDDLGIFKSSGLSVCPADAPDYISGRVDTVTRSKGGQGVVREIADRLLASQGRLDKMLKHF